MLLRLLWLLLRLLWVGHAVLRSAVWLGRCTLLVPCVRRRHCILLLGLAPLLERWLLLLGR